MNPLVIPLANIGLAVAGFAIALYIFSTKTQKKTKSMVCPIGTDCSSVVLSKYGKTFGIENSVFGMLYYVMIVLYFGSAALSISLPYADLLRMLVKAATAGAFAFSVYLIAVMKYRLRQWCSWCVLSTVITTGIFLLTFFA